MSCKEHGLHSVCGGELLKTLEALESRVWSVRPEMGTQGSRGSGPRAEEWGRAGTALRVEPVDPSDLGR